MNMSDILKTYTADPELATLLKAAARAGELVRVKADEETYVVRIEPETEAAAEDIWAGYDPERVRAALRRFGGSWSDLDADELKAALYRARAEGSRPPQRP